jgi:hypothetical protein
MHDERDGAVGTASALARGFEAEGTPRQAVHEGAIGYVRVGHNRIEKDPDRRIQQAITLAFTKFA